MEETKGRKEKKRLRRGLGGRRQGKIEEEKEKWRLGRRTRSLRS